MAMKTVLFRVRGGHPEPAEPVTLVEGSEFEANVHVADATTAPEVKPPFPFRSWDMGVKEPLTREDMYDDAE
jgi:hypothetical protein